MEKVAPQEVRPVLPRGSVVRVTEKSTRLAELDTRSWDCRQPLPLKPDSWGRRHQYYDGHGQQWLSIQGAYRVKLQRLQHRIGLIVAQIGRQEQKATERLSTSALHGLQDRIKSVTGLLSAGRGGERQERRRLSRKPTESWPFVATSALLHFYV